MAGFPVKVIFDTSICIPFINNGISYPVFELKFGKPVFYMSAIVIEELYAGAFDNTSIKLLDKIYTTFADLSRLITPDASDWQKTGKVVAKLGKKYGFGDNFLSKITKDVLIALTARKIGAIVVTYNKRDFLRIREFVDFKIYGGNT
ncbi:MAG: type II toxin-antitoxin system VapC family toxin [Deltaproteobacteria bacterium]|nr:type II toxin-antitoxin system VapC family toxin [Deltaproteobacteria bacterium]